MIISLIQIGFVKLKHQITQKNTISGQNLPIVISINL